MNQSTTLSFGEIFDLYQKGALTIERRRPILRLRIVNNHLYSLSQKGLVYRVKHFSRWQKLSSISGAYLVGNEDLRIRFCDHSVRTIGNTRSQYSVLLAKNIKNPISYRVPIQSRCDTEVYYPPLNPIV